jgi:hypothetical protein
VTDVLGEFRHSENVEVRRNQLVREFRATSWKQSGRRRVMSSTVVNLIIQLIAGVIGGNAIGTSLKDYNLGPLGNTIAGAIGGAGGGQILQALIPALAGATGGGLDIGSIIGQLVGGGTSGAILTVIVGVVKNMMAKQAT